MKKVLFVCHGNICRSVMAEFIFKDMVSKADLADEFGIDSAATSREEIGNDIYPPAKRKLTEKGIPFGRHYARRVTAKDYDNYDYIILMDDENTRHIKRIIPDDPEGKISLLLPWAGRRGSVADPWYTGDFETCYRDILEGCTALLEKIK